MPYDVPLILSLVIFFFSILGFLSSVMEKESPARHIVTFFAGAGLLGYAWYVSNGQLGLNSIPDAFLRIVTKFS